MRRQTSLVLAVALMISLLGCQGSGNLQQPGQLSIHGVTLGMKESDVRNLLGLPSAVHPERGELEFSDRGRAVFLTHGRVILISGTSLERNDQVLITPTTSGPQATLLLESTFGGPSVKSDAAVSYAFPGFKLSLRIEGEKVLWIQLAEDDVGDAADVVAQ